MATRRVSKHGMSGCPQCGQHIKLNDDWRETVCPFCETQITRPLKARAFPGRGGLIAASLLSVGLVGCEQDPDPSPDTGAMGGAGGVGGAGGEGGAGAMGGAGGAEPEPQPAPEPSVQPLYGEPSPEAEPEPAPEPAPMPEYGIPPEPEPVVDAGVDMALAPDAGPMPEYGAPPVEPDAGDVPLYGIPPSEDMGVPEADAAPEADMADPEPAPAPLYGIPPEPERE